MTIILRRPSVLLVGGLWVGLLAGGRCGSSPLVAAAPLAGIVTALIVIRRDWLHLVFLVLSFFMLGVLRSPESGWNTTEIPSDVAAEQRFPVVLDVKIPFVLGDCADQIGAEVCNVFVGYPALAGNRVILRGLQHLDRRGGRVLRVGGSFGIPRRRLNPFAVDRLEQNLRRGVIGYVDVENSTSRGDSGTSTVLRLRRKMESLILHNSSPETRGMLEALLLGRRSDVSGDVEAVMKKAGTYHVLAISGLHVGIVVLLLTTLLSILRLGRIMRMAIAVACVLGYVIFTGARPSAQRAWTFFLLVSICRFLEWKIDYSDCVCAAGAILLLSFPNLAWDVGFKLSLAAVFGITLLVPQLAGAGKIRTSTGARLKHYVLTGVIASFSAQVFTLPVLLYHFGRVSLMGPISNLVVLPVVTLIVAAGMEALLAVPFWMGLAEVFMRGASTLVWLLFSLTGLLTGFIDPLVFAGRPATWKLVVYCSMLAYVALVRPDLNGKLKIVILLLLCTFLIVSPGRSPEGGLVVTFLYVGDGDACVIEMPNGTTLLIDAGACSRDFDAGRAYVLPFLAMKSVKRIDTAIITHSHNDHYGGLLSLMESVKVEEILIGARTGEAGYTGLLSEAALRGIDVRAIGRGDTLCYGETRIEVLHPPRKARWRAGVDPNAQSIVCRLTYRKISVLFTGDATPLVQSALADSGADLACNVLKVPHHGAPGGVDSAFAAALGARYAVVSVGSRFPSHPCPATIDLLERQGMRVLKTVSDGAVTIKSDGHSWRLGSELGGLATPPPTTGSPLPSPVCLRPDGSGAALGLTGVRPLQGQLGRPGF